MTDEASVARGHRAFNELTEVAWAFDAVADALVRRLRETPVGADAGVLKAHMALQNLDAVRSALQSVIDNGRVGEAALAARNAIAAAGLNRPT